MRLGLSAGILPSLRRDALRSSRLSYRAILGTRYRSNDATVFKDSLWKTLEAHRYSNRASLVRKVFDKPSSEAPELSRPAIPAAQTADSNSPKKQSSSDATIRHVSSRQTSRTKRKHRTSSEDLVQTPRAIPCEPIRWSVNSEQGRLAQSPWMNYLDASRQWVDGFSQLDAEIRALEKYLSPTPPEQGRVKVIVAEVRRILKNTIPHPPQVIGSRRTGLAMSHSDLDFILPVPDSARSIDRPRKPSPTRPQVIEIHSNLLYDVKYALQQCSSFNGRIALTGKRNSILTAVHHETGVRVQFYCGEGPPSSVEYINDYHAEYPAIRPLYMATRLILEAQDLFGSHQSSIESSTLVMLLVAFLKMNHGRFHGPNSLGEQLLAVLKSYGSEVDLTNTAVSVEPPSLFNADTVKDAIKKYNLEDLPAHLRGQRALVNLRRTAVAKRNIPAASRLCLQDPANYMNDLGRTCSRTRELQGAFAQAYDHLDTCLGAWERPKTDRLKNSLLASALRANFDDFNEVRTRITRAGNKI
ncbi:hypothetical protein BBP40_010502 [Aspergillus hancockii]|nr:hypothetical protein BBP40_010502 [Aspergillus hancockii]